MSAIADNLHTAPHADEPPPPLVFTDSAASKVKELVDEEGNPDLKLRVFVQGGGCSGFQYGFTFSEKEDGDEVTNFNKFDVVVDAMSLPYVNGCAIDWVDSLQGAGFTVKNPNAKGNCGCGSSFNV